MMYTIKITSNQENNALTTFIDSVYRLSYKSRPGERKEDGQLKHDVKVTLSFELPY